MSGYKEQYVSEKDAEEYAKISLDFDKEIGANIEEEEELQKPKSLDTTVESFWEDTKDVLSSITPHSFYTELLKTGDLSKAHEKAKWDYNKNVAQVVRDDWGIDDKVQNEGAWFQPDKVINPKTGVEERTGNKHFNDYTNEELDYLVQEYEKETGDDTYYEMINEKDNLIKKGYSSERHGIYDRYDNDPNFRDWIVTKNKKSANADIVERLVHGQSNNLDKRLISKANYDDYKGLIAGRTEVYKTPSHELFNEQTAKPSALFDKEGTGTKRTNTQKLVAPEIAKILTDNPYAEAVQGIRERTVLSKKKSFQEKLFAGDKIEPQSVSEQVKTNMKSDEKPKEVTHVNPYEKGTTKSNVFDSGWKKVDEWVEPKDGNVADLKSIQNPYSDETDKLSTKDFVKWANTGRDKERSFDDTQLSHKVQYQKSADELGKLFNISPNLNPTEKAVELNKAMSAMNWDMTDLGNTVGKLIHDKDTKSANAFANALEMYATTDTDLSQVGRGIKQLGSDFSTYLTLGINQAPKVLMKEGGIKAVAEWIRAKAGSKMAMEGAALGALYTGGFDAATQSIKVEGGQQDSIDVAQSLKHAGLGAVIGGAFGGLFRPTVSGKQPEPNMPEIVAKISKISKEMSTGDKSRKEMEILNGQRKSLRSLKNEYETAKSQAEKDKVLEDAIFDFAKKGFLRSDVEARIVANKAEEIADKTVIKPEKEIVRAETENVTTKDGLRIDAKDVKETKKEIEKSTFEVNNPKVDKGEVLPGQKFVAPIRRNMKIEYGYDKRGRVYVEQKHLLSHQGTSDQKATLKVVQNKEEINNWNDLTDAINDRMSFYEQDKALRDAFGQTQAKYKGSEFLTDKAKSQEMANAIAFERKQYIDLKNSPTTSPVMKRLIQKELKKFKDKKIVDYKHNPADLERASEKYYKQFDIGENSATTVSKRESELLRDYEELVASRKEGEFTRADKLDGTEKIIAEKKTLEAIESKAESIKNDAIDAMEEIRRRERLGGRIWKGDITPDIQKKYQKESNLVNDYRNAKSDIKQYKDGDSYGKKMPIEELRYREERRIQNREVSNSKETYKDKEEMDLEFEKIRKEYDDIEVTVKPKFTEKSEFKGKGGTEDILAKNEREAKELSRANQNHEFSVSNLKYYEEQGVGRRHRDANSGQRGQENISPRQKQLVDDYVKTGVLTKEEVASLSSPRNVLKKDVKDAIAAAKENAWTKIYEHHLKTLTPQRSIKFGDKPNQIRFQDTVVDASNSVAQMITVLLGSKKMAKLSKLHGGNGDIRTIIGLDMQKLFTSQELKTMKIPVDGTAKDIAQAWKDLVKPVFMTEQYGQGEKGLIRNLMKDNKWSEELATKFLTNYEKAFGKMAPELENLRTAIYDRMTHPELGSHFEYVLPDGFPVKFDLTKTTDGTVKIRGNERKIKLESKDLAELSRALMPNIIHSVDAYVARRMQEQGFHTVHDAFIVPQDLVKKDAEDAYTKIMQELNDGKDKNLLDDIMKSFGYNDKSKKIGDLDSDMIAKSEYKLGTEHKKDTIDLEHKPRKKDISKQLTEDEVLKDVMASNNHRKISTGQLIDAMVNEASYMPMGVARTSDDVFERQIALAHQSEKFNPNQSVKVPSGYEPTQWYRVQEEIFNEARAKLEYNPATTHALRGNHKFFDKNRIPIGSTTKTMRKLINEERRIGRKLLKNMPKSKQRELRKVGKSYEEIAQKVKKWHPNRKLQRAELEALELVRVAGTPIARDEWFPSISEWASDSEYAAYFKRQYGNTELSKQFNKLNGKRQWNEELSARKEEELLKFWQKEIPESESKNWTKNVLLTDYHAINGFDKTMSENFMRTHADIYNIAKDSINQGAKAIGRPENQIGFYHDSALGIAKRYNLPLGAVDIIDKMISIKSMTDDAWNFVERNKTSDIFKQVMEVRGTDKARSLRLFSENPESIVKGYVSEVYTAGKTLDDNGNVIWDAEAKHQPGAIVSDLERRKVGRTPEDFGRASGPKIEVTKQSMLEAQRNGMKITGKKDRKVANTKIREDLGRSNDFAEIMTATTSSIEKKEMRREVVKMTLDGEFGEVFSKVEKPGMVKISPEIHRTIDKNLQKDVVYVNKAMQRQILGTEQGRLFANDKSSQTVKMIDRGWNNLVTRMKQDVVLKNPSSYKNALAYNYTVGLSVGMNPVKQTKWQAQAVKEANRNAELFSEIAQLEARGKDTTEQIAELQRSELFEMEQIGLATNVIEGVKGNSEMLAMIMSEKAGSKKSLDTVVNNVLINQNSKTGKFSTNLFSHIDTMGRFALVKQFQEDGLSLAESVLKANGLLGDMNQIAPKMIQQMDDYGIVPFMKWFTQTVPQTLKMTKDNKFKAIGVAVGLYEISRGLENVDTTKDRWGSHNMSGYSPLESIADFAEMQFSKYGDFVEGVYREQENLARFAFHQLAPYILPGIVSKPIEKTWLEYEKAKDGRKWETMNMSKVIQKTLLPNRGDLYEFKDGDLDTRGGVQTMVEKYFPSTNTKKTYNYAKGK